MRLGDLVQGNQPWTICVDKGTNGIVMVKRLEAKKGKAKLATFQLLRHRNISQISQVFLDDNWMYLGYEYSRFTLEEILHVHIRLQERQIQVVAISVS